MDDLENPLTLAEAPVNRMVPLPAFFILIAACLATRNAPKEVVSIAFFAATGSISVIEPGILTEGV